MRDRLRFGLLPLIARGLLVAEFIVAARGKILDWNGQAAYMAAHGIHFIPVLLGLALAIELLGSLCVVTGAFASSAAAVMFVYLGIVSVELHAFWNMTGNQAGVAMTHFFKNMGMMGGLLMIAVYGPGMWAIRSMVRRE